MVLADAVRAVYAARDAAATNNEVERLVTRVETVVAAAAHR